MKKENLNRYVFTEEEVKQALGIDGEIEYMFHSTAFHTVRFDLTTKKEAV